jgi:hypothetical protein
VVQHLDPLQQPLADLQAGMLAGDWEGALELVGRVVDALRQVSAVSSLVGCLWADAYLWLQNSVTPNWQGMLLLRVLLAMEKMADGGCCAWPPLTATAF